MQNTCFLFRDGASVCQVNQQQAQREWKREKNKHQNGTIPFCYSRPFKKQTNKQTKPKQQRVTVWVLRQVQANEQYELNGSVSDWGV